MAQVTATPDGHVSVWGGSIPARAVKSLRGCSGNRQVLWLYQEGVRSGRSEGEEDAAATSTLAASRSPCIDTIHKYSMCLKYNLGIFAPDHSEHEI